MSSSLSDHDEPPPPPIHHHGSHDAKHHNADPHQLHHYSNNKLYTAIHAGNSVSLLKLIMDEVSAIPYKTKKSQGVSNDTEYIQKLIQEMNDILRHEFLHVDISASLNRKVQDKDWSSLSACRRSDSGTIGIIFLQCLTLQKTLEVIVAKATTISDFEKIVFVNQIAQRYFHINCPEVRLIERSEAEFSDLEVRVKGLFCPLNEDLYDLGGHHSPKDLFSSQGIMLLSLVRGKPLCHKSQGQRFLSASDYHTLGKLFLLDLLIRNTDRLPCRKAMPRPGSKGIGDHGNAGNIMFGQNAGEVWSIDPEMQTKVDPSVEATYGDAFESVVYEIIHHEAEQSRYKALESLFFAPIPGLAGILDISLNDLSPWDSGTQSEREAIPAILQMIRLRANAEENHIIRRAGNFEPPQCDDEREWREWIRKAAPRAIIDIFEFLEAFTGIRTPPFATVNFESGFIESLEAAKRFMYDYQDEDPNGWLPTIKESGGRESSIDINFVLRMISRANKYYTPDLLHQANRRLSKTTDSRKVKNSKH